MKSQEFNKFLKENSLVLGLTNDQTFLMEKIYQFQFKHNYFEIIEFQKLNSDIELEFIDEQLNFFQEQKYFQYNIGTDGIVFDFKNLINLFNKLNQNIFFLYWSQNEKILWIKKMLLSEKNNQDPKFVLDYIENHFNDFVNQYLKNEKFDITIFLNKLNDDDFEINELKSPEKKLSKPILKENDELIEESENVKDTAFINFFKELDNTTIKKEKKLTQKSWFEEDE